MAVEDETESVMEPLSGNEMKASDIVFKSINLDDPGSEGIADKLEIRGH